MHGMTDNPYQQPSTDNQRTWLASLPWDAAAAVDEGGKDEVS